MSNSVLVLSFRDGSFLSPCLRDLFPGMIGKQEVEGEGLAIHLSPDYCAIQRADGCAIYACSGEYHVSEPLLVLPPGTVVRAIGDHELECHHRPLPIN